MDTLGYLPKWTRLGKKSLIIFIAFLIPLSLFALYGCAKKKVLLEYNRDSGNLVIQVSRGGGLPHPADDLIPVFRLYGDGRVIKWEGEGFLGMLKEARLNRDEVEDLLQRIYDTGYFELKEEYREPQFYDATYREINLHLVEMGKTVRVWVPEKVKGFEEAYQLIMEHPLKETSDYIPEKGYLVVVKYPRLDQETPQFLDASSHLYQVLPEVSILAQAAESRTAIAIDGVILVEMKRYQISQGFSGIMLPLGEYVLTLYPVYEPRTVQKPG